MKTNELSMVEFRNETGRVIKGLRQGESYSLTYRGKPLARLIPEKQAQVPSVEDPLYHFHELAIVSAPLTDSEMDALVYELR
ncbi:MAG: hypothetical protein HC904_13505 [Blastochloris sp.]|nr:hypothetical protein [Blastochloris sp.]